MKSVVLHWLNGIKLWGISVRRVQKLCEENRIDGIVRLPRAWLIPQDAQKPADGRYKQNKNEFIADNKENTR